MATTYLRSSALTYPLSMKPVLSLVTLLCFVAGFGATTSQAQDTDHESQQPRISVHEANPWTHLELNNDPANFQFAIVSDRTGSHRPGVFEDAVNKLNLLRPEFVMSVGDLIEGYTEDRDVLHHEWDEFDGFVEGLEMPFFYVPGNHDITNPVMADVWEERLGPSYYHFVYQDVLFLCLNSEDTEASNIGEQQQAYVSKTLAENPDVRWTLVFLHKPLWLYADAESGELEDTGWAAVEAALGERPHTVFAGHEHRYTKYERNDQDYFVLATTGGTSPLRGRLHGQFDHVVWVSMTDIGPRIANLMLDGIWDKNIRTERIASMVDPLLRRTAVRIDPVWVDGSHFTHGLATVRVTNDADVPLIITASVSDTSLLQVTPSAMTITIPPNSVEFANLTLGARKATAVDDLPPLVLNWSAVYDQTDTDIPAIGGSSRLVISREFELPYRDSRVVIDGNLDDWPELPFVVNEPAKIRSDATSWTGPADCSFKFGVEIEEDRLVIGVEVTDDRKIMKRAAAWKQDGIEVRIDGRPDPKRSFSTGRYDIEMTDHIFVAISPAEPASETRVNAPDRLAALGVESAGRATESGYSYEIAVPLDYFADRQGVDWNRLRLNIAIDDWDDEQGPLAQLWWHPDWRTSLTYSGSGTFVATDK